MTAQKAPTHYETLGVHPAAPLDLITAAYWYLAGSAQTRRSTDGSVDQHLHELSKAYAVLSDASARAVYDASIGAASQPLVPRTKRRRGLLRRLLGRRSLNGGGDPSCDYYEVIRVDRAAPPAIIDEGYAIMRNQYLRLVRLGHARVDLLDLLEEAYAVTSDPARRSEYDASRNGHSPARAATKAKPDKRAKAQTATKQASKKVTPKKTASKGQKTASKPDGAAATAPRAAPKAKADRLASLRTAVQTGGSFAVAAARTLVVAAKVAVFVLLLLPRLVIGLAQFLSGLVRNLIDDSPRPAVPAAVRRIWPDEEEALLARLAKSTGHATPALAAIDASSAHVIVEGPEEVARYEVSRWPVSVGAADDCDIVLPGLAPQQLRLLDRDGKFILYSLAESPPVHVNGQPIAWFELTADDFITVGPHKISVQRVPR